VGAEICLRDSPEVTYSLRRASPWQSDETQSSNHASEAVEPRSRFLLQLETRRSHPTNLRLPRTIWKTGASTCTLRASKNLR
jgi:hypothetical protein